MPKDHGSSRKSRKHKEKEEERQARKARKRQVELRPVSRTVQGTAPPQTSTNTAVPSPTTTTTPQREPSLPPPVINQDPPRGRSPHRLPSPSSHSKEDSLSPPPTPKRKRASKISGLDDDAICARYTKLHKTLETMGKDALTRRTTASISDYLDKARLLPRIVHPFINIHEALVFGLTYKEGDFDWDADDNEDDGLEQDAGDNEESPKAIRERERARKKELFYQYKALIDIIPGLKTNIHLMDDDELESLAEYLQKACGKARGTDSSHIANRVVTYMLATTDEPRGDVPRLEAILPKGLRGYGNYHTAQALIPPNFLDSFERDWQKVCDMILKKEVRIPADDWPSFLFDDGIYNQPEEDSDLQALLRNPFFKM
ncbi:hypothetical protein C8T65DRAFT_750868, partial [Cerioporus squamosus]